MPAFSFEFALGILMGVWWGKVPTVCIESVYVFNNTSVIVDEILSQRIGMVPLNVDPALVDMKECMCSTTPPPLSLH